MRRIKESNVAVKISIAVLALISIMSILAFLSPYDPNKVNLLEKFQDPSLAHPFGTDGFGRDYFTRALYGGRVSLMVGLFSMLISISFGTIYGAISGFSGKMVDVIMMRLVDILMAIPSFLLIITLNVYLNPGMGTLIATIGLFSWMSVARIVRAEVMSLKEREFVLAATGLGAKKHWIIFKHMLKNVSSPVLVAATISIANAILMESTLSYLGFGVKAPNASWGSMLQDAQTYILTRPGLAVYPGILILVTVLCFNVLGDSMRKKFE